MANNKAKVDLVSTAVKDLTAIETEGRIKPIEVSSLVNFSHPLKESSFQISA